MSYLDQQLNDYLSDFDKENVCGNCESPCEKEYCNEQCYKDAQL